MNETEMARDKEEARARRAEEKAARTGVEYAEAMADLAQHDGWLAIAERIQEQILSGYRQIERADEMSIRMRDQHIGMIRAYRIVLDLPETSRLALPELKETHEAIVEQNKEWAQVELHSIRP